MRPEPVVVKINSTYNGRIFFNVIFLGIVLTAVFNWYIALIAAAAVILSMISRKENNTVQINPEKDTVCFPAACQYSPAKNIIGLFLPLFQTTNDREIKLSELRKYSYFRKKDSFFVELYLPEPRVVVLQFFNENTARQIVDGLHNARPELYQDDYPSCLVNSAKSWRAVFIVIVLLFLVVALFVAGCYRNHRVAAFLNFPYLLWLLFAAYLNGYVMICN
jgi:hypothetical protein